MLLAAAFWLASRPSAERPQASRPATAAAPPPSPSATAPVPAAPGTPPAPATVVATPSVPATPPTAPVAVADDPPSVADDDSAPVVPAIEAATARIRYAGQDVTLASDGHGRFPRFYIAPNAEVPVEVTLPEAQPDDAVAVQVMDGGRFENERPSQVGRLDEQRRLAFRFRANEDRGIYRVVLSRGGQSQTLQFWAGEPMPLTTRR